MDGNTLYYGDNLDILRNTTPVYIPPESVDLIYLDPPFNSNATYNVLFAEKDGKRSAAQIKAFEDTWHWEPNSARTLWEVIRAGGPPAQAMQAFQILLGENDMLAYLAMMAPRLIELHRAIKPTGSIYLHCDPTASHYLKVLMDAVFGPSNFRNEISWKRTPFAGSSKARAQQFPRSHDVILFYSKTGSLTWHGASTPYSAKYLARFKWDDSDGRGPYRKTLLKTYSEATFERLKSDNRLVSPQKSGSMWSYKQYLSESSGTIQIDDVWTDLNALNPVAKERLGYPTQKPESLLERIIMASSNPGDLVLDPFCGCGTAIAAAQKLGRRWIGIDVTHLAIGLMKSRLNDAFGLVEKKDYHVTGEPTTLPDAQKLAEEDKFQFQAWALGLVGARTATSARKGADGGIDGRLYFHEGDNKPRQVILSVKGGHLKADDIRALGQVVSREGADIGVLISLQEPSQPMRADAASAGFYESPWGVHPRLQILTIGELLGGKKIDMPATRGTNITFKQAPKAKAAVGANAAELWDSAAGE